MKTTRYCHSYPFAVKLNCRSIIFKKVTPPPIHLIICKLQQPVFFAAIYKTIRSTFNIKSAPVYSESATPYAKTTTTYAKPATFHTKSATLYCESIAFNYETATLYSETATPYAEFATPNSKSTTSHFFINTF